VAEIGIDCDIALTHPEVNGGEPYGFILTPDPTHGRSGVSIQREVNAGTGEIHIYIFFTIMLADDLLNPDGSEHVDNREVMYAMLLEYLGKNSQICVSTVLGTWLGIGPLGHSATELHLIKGSMVSVKLANVSVYHPPVDSSAFLGSQWQPEPPKEGALTWDTSLWR